MGRIQPFQTTPGLRAARGAFLPPRIQHPPGESPLPLLRRPTCVQNPCKDPALPVADGPEARALPSAQDVHAARPAAGALPPGVIPIPPSLQDAVVIVAVHLGENQEKPPWGSRSAPPAVSVAQLPPGAAPAAGCPSRHRAGLFRRLTSHLRSPARSVRGGVPRALSVKGSYLAGL